LKYRFGISLKEYNEMFQLQNGRCAICGKHQSELSKSLSVDHNHDTKEIRGLLCQNCNSVLGHALDNVEILRACIDYLIGEI
jgi:DNA-directed RNA polymerase subunit RPC12/RpoP